MTERPSVAISIPLGDHGRFDFWLSLIRMLWPETENQETEPAVVVHVERSSSLLQNRRRLVSYAMKRKSSHILFIDGDMTFPAETMLQLLKHDKDIVAANCTTRVIPALTTAFKGKDRVQSWQRNGLEKVEHVGMAVMMIKTAVFNNLPEPWFAFPWDRTNPGTYMSEDVFFCQLAKKFGYEIWIDHDLSNKIGHLGEIEFGHELTEVALDAAQRQRNAAE